MTDPILHILHGLFWLSLLTISMMGHSRAYDRGSRDGYARACQEIERRRKTTEHGQLAATLLAAKKGRDDE